ncbi:carotenoid oxygenase family protein [Streptomyces himalayensis]|uniref:carotenoid oxygenase family protein n=1 Tax=Streptomyces himalayensis TaxID=2820085 RepID=UPI00215D613F|nr:carotenoid oxygenase family protein [Streptomyces himalayensis]
MITPAAEANIGRWTHPDGDLGTRTSKPPHLCSGMASELAGAARFGGGVLADDPARRRKVAVGCYATMAGLGAATVAIPADLVGALFRTSSNPRFQPCNTDRYRWWEGDGMVCGICLREGKAAYRTRWVATDSMKVEVEAGEAIYSGLVNGGTPSRVPEGTPPARNVAKSTPASSTTT